MKTEKKTPETKENKIEKTEKFQALTIPQTLDFTNIPGLTVELQEKLTLHKPRTIAQAHLIPGMTPAAISLLIFHIRNTLPKTTSEHFIQK